MIVGHRESRGNRRMSEILICILPCFVLADDTIALEVASSSEILNFIIPIIQP